MPELLTGKVRADGGIILKASQSSRTIFLAGRVQTLWEYITTPKPKLLDTPADPDILKTIPLTDLWNGGGVTTGADPEIFIVDQHGIIIPAFDFLPPAKNTFPYSPYQSANSIYNDGFQAEFTVSPTTCHSSMVDLYQSQLTNLLAKAKKHNPQATLSCNTVLEIPEQLLLLAESHNVQLGCLPSINAYNHHGEVVVSGRELPVRFVGSHIHIGTDRTDISEENASAVVHAMDGICGIASIALFGDRENLIRRKFYGLAGEYRLPSHGLEYRVISGMMLQHPVYTHLLLDLARYSSRLGAANLYPLHNKVPQTTIIEAINNSDQKLARETINQNLHIFTEFCKGCYSNNYQNVLDLLLGKVKLSQSPDLTLNWRLGPQTPYTGTPTNRGVLGKVTNLAVKSWLNHSESPNCSVARLEPQGEI